MPNLRESYIGQWSAGLTASGAAYLGAHLVDKEAGIGSNSLAGTVEWLGVVGASVSASALAMGGIGVLAARSRQKQKEQIRATVPKFEADTIAPEKAAVLVESLDLSRRVQDMLAPVADTVRVSHLVDIGFSQEERVKMVADEMARDLAFVRSKHPVGKFGAATWFDVADAGYVLDQVYPISDQDSLTPETVAGERHWFDFAEHQAILQAA